MVATKGPRGIDTDLDNLRKSSANLVDALKAGSNELSASNTIFCDETASAITRVSESQAAFQAHEAAPSMQVPRAEGWNNTMNLSKEYMDAKAWKSEARDMQSRTEAATSQSAPAAAGTHKESDKKAPSFFAWPERIKALEATGTAAGGADAVDSATGWQRVGAGWKSQDGVFYSDADLVADVLTASATAPTGSSSSSNNNNNGTAQNIISFLGVVSAAAEGLQNDDEEESSGAEFDAIGDIYHTETEDSYRWTQSKAEARTSRLHVDKTTPPAKLSVQSLEDVRNWITEYDAQCLKAINTQLSGAIAGQSSGMSAVAKAPLSFSWARSVAAIRNDRDRAHTPARVAVTPPYGLVPNTDSTNWTTEYVARFREGTAAALPPPPPTDVSGYVARASAPPALPVAVVPPYGTDGSKNSTMASEYHDNFRVGGKGPAASKVRNTSPPAARAPVSESEFASLLRGFQALQSAVGAVSASAEIAAPASNSKKQPTLRFNTESGRAYKWPIQAVAAVVVVPKNMGVFALSESEEASTSEARSCFVKADVEGLVAMRAARGSGNLSNQSDPALLAHKFSNVKARSLPPKAAPAAYASVAEVKAPDSIEEEDVGTLTAESEMYSGDELDAETETEAVGAVVMGLGSDSAYALEPVPAPHGATAASPHNFRENAPAPAPAPEQAPAQTSDTAKLSFSKPKKAHLRGKALMLDKQKKASRDAALGHIANANKGSKKGSPVLRNSRYPGTSDAQNGRWHTEAASQFVWRPMPLQL